MIPADDDSDDSDSIIGCYQGVARQTKLPESVFQ